MISKTQAEEILTALEDGDLSKYGIWEIGIMLDIREQTGCLIINKNSTDPISCFNISNVVVVGKEREDAEASCDLYKHEVNDLLSHATTAQLLFLKMKYGISIT